MKFNTLFNFALLFLYCNIILVQQSDGANPTSFLIPIIHHNNKNEYLNIISMPNTIYSGNYDSIHRPIEGEGAERRLNGKERYKNICRIIHGIGSCYG